MPSTLPPFWSLLANPHLLAEFIQRVEHVEPGLVPPVLAFQAARAAQAAQAAQPVQTFLPAEPNSAQPVLPNAGPLAPPPGLTGSPGVHPGVHPGVMIANDRVNYWTGLEILLDYLNTGNTFVDLLRVQQDARSRTLATGAAATTTPPRSSTAGLPRSWPRTRTFSTLPSCRGTATSRLGERGLRRSPDGGSDGDSDGSEAVLFPGYQEHTLLDDEDIALIVWLRDYVYGDLVCNGALDLRNDRYTRMRGAPILGTDLFDSPILRFLPEVLMEMAFLNPRDIVLLDPARAE
ncbi:hypothetical protein TOPH_01776 [Tolypocladium ophioglossoides CBS 100239]|uniref:Uncharacterized protein n=1 Tax=Tolypocladium ophioglossoides (strain CBS 100239) TaxID=1163406 RepID=A0A0L0NJ88_TOLOC|nr:hypothetical protein TOPH_01776 [Tolypocladium ophioglossoides CBS 100239]